MKRFSALAMALFLAAGSAWPWGATGHRVVARIAERHLGTEAAAAIRELLGAPTLAGASTWADEIRPRAAWRHTAPWHFVDIEDGRTYATSRKNPGGDIIVKIRDFERVLRNPAAGRQDKAVALKFLVHFVADVHQPLHVGRSADKGGNLIRIRWRRRSASLHHLWDELLIRSAKLSDSEWVELLDRATPRQLSTWKKSDVLDWVQESYSYRGQVYDIGQGLIGPAYVDANMPLLRQRLLQSGIRLAAVLNSVFGK